MDFLDKIAENRIRTSRDLGELDNLPGQGKPLALDDDSAIPTELRVSYRILKNSGFLPPEIALRAEILRVEDLLQDTTTDADKALLVLKLGILKSQLTVRKR